MNINIPERRLSGLFGVVIKPYLSIYMIMFTVDSDLLYTDGIIIGTYIQTHLDISVTSARELFGGLVC